MFSKDWIDEVKQKYINRPSYQLPVHYRFIVDQNNEAQREYIESFIHEIENISTKIALIDKLRNPDTFIQTYNEILFANIFKNSGFSLSYEESINGYTPDWVVGSSDNVNFIFEVLTIFAPRKFEQQARQWNEIRQRIKSIDHSNFLSISSHNQRIFTALEVNSIIAFIKNWLSKNKIDSPEEKREVTYDCNGQRIHFSLLPKSSAHLAPVECLGPIMTTWVDQKRLEKSILEKNRKYRKLGLPVVIGVATTFDSCLSLESLMGILFGDRVGGKFFIQEQNINQDYPGVKNSKIFSNSHKELNAVFFTELSSPLTFTWISNPFSKGGIDPDKIKNIQVIDLKLDSQN